MAYNSIKVNHTQNHENIDDVRTRPAILLTVLHRCLFSGLAMNKVTCSVTTKNSRKGTWSSDPLVTVSYEFVLFLNKVIEKLKRHVLCKSVEDGLLIL